MLAISQFASLCVDAARTYDTSQTGNAPTGSTAFGDFTYVDRTVTLTPGKTVFRIGIYCTGAATVTLKICERTGAGNYTFYISESFSHTGSGWEDFQISVPFPIPASGTFHIAAHTNSTQPNAGSISRATKAGNLTGAQTGFTEATNVTPATRAHYL